MAEAAVSQGLAAILGLRQLIMDGELRAGDRLSEVRLAARLEVSRTPLRLALAQLEHEGLLEPVPGGGFVVRSFSGRQVLDAIELRGLLEGQAARLAALRHTGPRALGDLVACVAKLDRIVGVSGSPTGDEFEFYVELNEAFHNELFVLADSDVLRDAYERVLALPFAQPSFFLPAQSDTSQFEPTLATGNQQHHEILNAIERGDGDEAERLARDHAQLAVRNLEAVLETGGLEKLPGSSLISDAGWTSRPSLQP
ncbi:MAG: GntR family transcriptional regulator [Acidobacteriota bacterium]|nr:GntR family transcriptional regulator [Acidobacteriota bacterium]